MKVTIVFVFKLAILTKFCKSLKIWNQNEKYTVLSILVNPIPSDLFHLFHGTI